MMVNVVLYGREGCCLCDEAREILLEAQRKHPFSLEERDIDQDEVLQRAYLERIPVVAIDGVEAFDLFVDPHELERRLQRARAQISADGGLRENRHVREDDR